MLCNDLGNNSRQNFPSDKFLTGGKCFNKNLCYGEKSYFIVDFSRDLYTSDTIEFVELFILDSNDNNVCSIPLDFEILTKYVKISIDLNSTPEDLIVGEKYNIIIRSHSEESIITKILKFKLLDSMGKSVINNSNNSKVVVINSNVNVTQTTTTTTESTCTICDCTTCNCN